jgi:hypothetical protein
MGRVAPRKRRQPAPVVVTRGKSLPEGKRRSRPKKPKRLEKLPVTLSPDGLYPEERRYYQRLYWWRQRDGFRSET